MFAWQRYILKFLSRSDFTIARSNKKLHEALKTKQQKEIVFIDDHGRTFKENSWSYNYLKKFLWYLPDENRTRKDIELFNQEKNNQTIKYRLIEAIYTKISIYDERIQQEISNPYNNIPQISLRELHLLGKIFVPEIETENLTDDAVVKNLEGLLKKRFKTDDYVIVHFTLFEKLAESKGYSTSIKGDNNLKKYYEKLVGEWKLETRGKFLVFCSGRGRPSNLFLGCYYLHLSTLQYFLIRSISKYSLVNVLKSLRKL